MLGVASLAEVVEPPGAGRGRHLVVRELVEARRQRLGLELGRVDALGRDRPRVGVASEPERGAPPAPKRFVRLALGGRLGLAV